MSPAPGASPSLSVTPPAISTRLKPELYRRLVKDREILTSASLEGERYSYYAGMLVHTGLERARRVLTNYQLYAQMISYVDRAEFSPETRILDIQGGIWKFRLRSWVRFEERGERWIRYRVVGGHFAGLEGNIYFEPQGEKGTLVFFDGQQVGNQWPPKFVIERGAEIVFGFTAKRMRNYLESKQDVDPAPGARSGGENHPHGSHDSPRSQGSDLPQPRSHL